MTTYRKRTQNYLVDSDIEQLVSEGKLFRENFDPAQLSGAAYDLRLGPALTSRNHGRTFNLEEDAYVVEPGEVVTVETLEVVDFSEPLLFGLIVSSHTQVSRGVFHPATVIDPGFSGPLAITLTNQGNSGYRLSSGDRIGKLIISPLFPAPERIYGQSQRPRVLEGSLDHSLVVENLSTEGTTAIGDFVGGPFKTLVERVEILERDADLHQAQSKIRRYAILVNAVWVVAAGATGAILAERWKYIGPWFVDVLTKMLGP